MPSRSAGVNNSSRSTGNLLGDASKIDPSVGAVGVEGEPVGSKIHSCLESGLESRHEFNGASQSCPWQDVTEQRGEPMSLRSPISTFVMFAGWRVANPERD
ncbi:hypothetical protein IF1G_04942 [Cordyceps javanica]|uniref:Uncharacterized protein n=1 Tax=Cordyceps javanica TaxID=43265 RepID=A0A545V3Q7_9HYPO|nr:hypothetical protein IF1G_04942 [Cordyceps javanica]TQW07655.1 hypothetical protein IF2G_04816 [Cordyceps javanica]